MADYGHDLEFGYFLDPGSREPERTLDIAQRVDALGYDLIGIQDHPYQPLHFDAVALAAYILGQTGRVRLFQDVANLPMRHPVVLAKAAATLDQLSGGRFELGLGAGAFWDAIRGLGGPVRKPKQALDALEEAVIVIRGMWSGQRGMSFGGEYYPLNDAHGGPVPAHQIGIWLGVLGPKALALTGRIADGWVPSMSYVPPVKAMASNAIIDRAAVAAGREPSAIRRIYNVTGTFAPTNTKADDIDREIVGPPEHWVEVLTHFALDFGFSTFVLGADPDQRTLQTFIDEVAPAVKQRVAGARRTEYGIAETNVLP
ncbi:MAG: LLM class flavin-dependent oxidoreductase [Chloroflexia bacterium]|nr:LLM class flavin-dependent oxidoreductase [Chloroflexia bacterium]